MVKHKDKIESHEKFVQRRRRMVLMRGSFKKNEEWSIPLVTMLFTKKETALKLEPL